MNQIVIFVIQALGGRENLDILSQSCTATVWEPFKPEKAVVLIFTCLGSPPPPFWLPPRQNKEGLRAGLFVWLR